MPNAKSIQWNNQAELLYLLFGFGVVSLSVLMEFPLLLGLLLLPLLYFILEVSVARPRLVYYAFIASVPLSTEVLLPGGLGTDFPSETLMWTLCVMALLYLILRFDRIWGAYYIHPISIAILATFAWMTISTFQSDTPVHSIKQLLSKSWYIVALYAMPMLFLKDQKSIKLAFRILSISLLFTICIILFRHGYFHQFSFKDTNKILNPFYRNHVAYASIIAVTFPYMVWYFFQNKRGFHRWGGLALLMLILFALYFSYTRAAIGAVVLAVGFYLVFQTKFFKPLIFLSIGILLSLSIQMIKDNAYLDYAPDYSKTVSHWEFDDLVEATINLQDISTMERFYRWVAGYHMVSAKPIFGFGPGSFYDSYRPYTVKSFRTYVSDNPEKSGMHNYFLLLFVEQGFLGLLLFLILTITALFWSQRLYFLLKDPIERNLIAAAATSIFIVLVLSFMNDLIETDKVGTFFYLSLAFITRASVLHYQKAKVETTNP